MEALEEARGLITTRIAELDTERAKLVAALSSLSAVSHGSGSSKPANRSNGKSTRRRAKRAARGQRQVEFLSALESRPGASMAEIARRMGVRPQQLYPIARRLVGDGLIVKAETGYAAASSKPAAAKSARKRASTSKRTRKVKAPV
jgi:hypothetical protein